MRVSRDRKGSKALIARTIDSALPGEVVGRTREQTLTSGERLLDAVRSNGLRVVPGRGVIHGWLTMTHAPPPADAESEFEQLDVRRGDAMGLGTEVDEDGDAFLDADDRAEAVLVVAYPVL
jgi:hypothetical protein